MKRFGRNVLRLAKHSKGSFLGAAFIIAIGIFIYVAMTDTLLNLKAQMDVYYNDSAMADVFAQVSGISDTDLKRLEEIPGIEKASGKMAEDVRLLAEGQKELVTVHLLSYDQGDALNKLNLSAPFTGDGQMFLGGRMEEAYGYEGGKPLTLLWHGKSGNFNFSGTCNGPDYIYSIPPGGAMIPDGKIYDIACISKTRMEELTGRHDSVNELGFALSPGYTYEDVRYTLSEQLQNYGLISLNSSDDQLSFNMVKGEMKKLTSMGTVLPVMFMSISVFMLYVVLKKMIDRDQSLIGTMKAFGMKDQELMAAYLLEGAAVGLLGAVLGAALALPFGWYMFHMYVNFFNLPDTVYHSYVSTRLLGLFIAVGTGILAVFLGIRDILSISPAQAMRAKAPSARDLPMPSFFIKRLGFLERMGCRSIARHPFRGFLIVLAICFPFSMSAVMLCFNGVANTMFLDQFEKVQVYDLQLSLDRHVSPVRAVQSGEELEGVVEAEAVCTQPVELKSRNLSEFAMIYGLNRNSALWRIMDSKGIFHEPPVHGLILNKRTADKMHVEQGDMVEVISPGLTAGDVKVPVTSVVSESFGSGCYMSLDSFQKIFRTEPVANTVLLKTKTGKTDEVKQKMIKTSRVTWLVDTRKMVDTYRAMMGSTLVMVGIFIILSSVSGGILIYNISMINIRERSSEFGTLMIMGESNKEIRRLLFFEQFVYFFLGILGGIPGSWGIKVMMEKMVVSDSYTFNLVIGPDSYGMAFLICMGITVVACAAQLRYIGRIQLTEILKERE